jgi:hypothetical protein
MIHYKKQGECVDLGLNVTVGLNHRWWPWITFIWAWYNISNHQLTSYRVRIRTWQPTIFREKGKQNVVDSFLRFNDLSVVQREFIEDLYVCAEVSNNVTLLSLLKRYVPLTR